MLVKLPGVTAADADVQSVAVGQVAIGPITIGELTLSNANLTMSAAQATLQNLSVKVALHITFDWHIHIGLPDGIPDINIGDSYDLGTLTIGMTIGNVVIPGLNNLSFDIPGLTASNVQATAAPLALQLGNLKADDINITDVKLPAAGFTLAGLGLTSLVGSGLTVPAASVGHATIGHIHGDPIAIPTLSLPSLTLPNIKIPTVSSNAPLTIPAVLPTDSVGFDAGILKAAIHVTPTVTMHVEHLQISGATATAKTGDVVLHGITLPYDALNITLSQIGIDTIAIPSFTAS